MEAERGVCVSEGRCLRVLIVEDEMLIALDLAEMVREHGDVVVGVASDACEAFRLFADHQPDLVLMDISLVDGDDGIDVAKAMRLVREVPIVFCTAHGDPATLRRIAALSKCELVLKPIGPAALHGAMQRVSQN